MPETPPSLIGQVLMLTLRDFQRRLDTDLQSRGVQGIGARHRAVFLHLGQHGDSRSVDLAQAAGIRPQSMMAIINELEDMELIARRPDPQDSRAKLVTFTPKGRKFVKELTRSTQTVWRQYADILGEKKLGEIADGLQTLISTKEEEKHG